MDLTIGGAIKENLILFRNGIDDCILEFNPIIEAIEK